VREVPARRRVEPRRLCEGRDGRWCGCRRWSIPVRAVLLDAPDRWVDGRDAHARLTMQDLSWLTRLNLTRLAQRVRHPHGQRRLPRLPRLSRDAHRLEALALACGPGGWARHTLVPPVLDLGHVRGSTGLGSEAHEAGLRALAGLPSELARLCELGHLARLHARHRARLRRGPESERSGRHADGRRAGHAEQPWLPRLSGLDWLTGLTGLAGLHAERERVRRRVPPPIAVGVLRHCVRYPCGCVDVQV
jgi:hypothetical protein